MPQPAFYVVFYELPQDGGEPFALRELDMENPASVPMAGDFVYAMPNAEPRVPYRVIARHFDPAGLRVAVILERVEYVENSPWVDAPPREPQMMIF